MNEIYLYVYIFYYASLRRVAATHSVATHK